MQSICIQYGGVTTIKSYSSWAKAVQAVEEHLKSYYPNLKGWEVEVIMLQLEEHSCILYKNFYADLS